MVGRAFGRVACLLLLTIFSNAGLQAGQTAVAVPPELIAASSDVLSDAQISRAYLPVYPWDAVKNGVDGWVTLGFVIDEIGLVQNIQVLDAQPNGVFEEVAIEALARWEIYPARGEHLPCSSARQGAIVTFTFDHNQNPKRLNPGEASLEILSLLNLTPLLSESNRHITDVAKLRAPLDSEVEILDRVSPRYPPKAIREKLSGVVAVVFDVLPDGEPSNFHVIQSVPPKVFDENTIDALKRWRYKPAMRNNKPVTRSVCLWVHFGLPSHTTGWFGPPGIRSPFGIPYGSVTAPPDW